MEDQENNNILNRSGTDERIHRYRDLLNQVDDIRRYAKVFGCKIYKN